MKKKWTVVYHQTGPNPIQPAIIYADYISPTERGAVFFNTSFDDPVAIVPYANVRIIRQDTEEMR